MKKNYLSPVTENVQLHGCSIMQAAGGSTTPFVPPTPGGWNTPGRKMGRTLYI